MAALERPLQGADRRPLHRKRPGDDAKALQAFLKIAPTMKVKAAVVQGKAVAAGAVDELASLPGKPEL